MGHGQFSKGRRGSRQLDAQQNAGRSILLPFRYRSEGRTFEPRRTRRGQRRKEEVSGAANPVYDRLEVDNGWYACARRLGEHVGRVTMQV